jgi:hypothetical protein
MRGNELERDIVAEQYGDVAEQSTEKASALQFAAAALDEVLNYPYGGSVDMFEFRRRVAKKAGMEELVFTSGRYDEIDENLAKGKELVEEFKQHEEHIAADAKQTAQRVRHSGLPS